MYKKLLFLICFIPAFAYTALALPSVEDLIPQPRQAYTRLVYSGMFAINTSYTKIYLSNDQSNPNIKAELDAAAELNRYIKQIAGDTLQYAVLYNSDTLVQGGIVIGINNPAVNNLLRHIPDQLVQVSATYPGKEGYVLDVLPPQLIIAGCDREGAHNAIMTMMQLVQPGNATHFLFAARVIDAPEYPVRWVQYPTNFQVGSNITKMKAFWDEISLYKLNGAHVGDSKFSFIHDRAQFYIDSLVSMKKYSDEHFIKFILSVMPFGYSNDMLYNDPNLAAGLPVQNQKFFIEGDTARLVPSVQASIPNGGFEDHKGDNFPGFAFIDEPGVVSFFDSQEKFSGNVSLRLDNSKKQSGSNARVCYFTVLKPWTQYHVSFMIKTENINGDMNFFALAKDGRALTYYNLGVERTTNGWKKVDYIFNTLYSDTVRIYWGTWGGNRGTMWLDDLKLGESAFVNLIRRDGAPLFVDNPLLDLVIREGRDFDTLTDPKMGVGAWAGIYDAWHQPPTLRIKKDGAIKNGDTILVSYYNTTYIYDGQVMATMSDPKVYDVVERDFRILDSLLKPDMYFMGHDEIRVLNWDYGDQVLYKKAPTPAEILAYNVAKCVDIIHKYRPNADIWDWTDMFDDFHNAHPAEDKYYLVNGSLKGVADLIPKTIGMVNWNTIDSATRMNSLDFFSSKGFRQISAPFYDAGPEHIRSWKEAARSTPNFLGMMYTTWIGDYSKIDAFANYAWNHAPYIYHYPPALNIPLGHSFNVAFGIKGDKWDDDWKFTSGKVYFRTKQGDKFTSIDYTLDTTGFVTVNLGLDDNTTGVQYYITGTDNRGWTTRIPFGEDKYFEYGSLPVSVNDNNNDNDQDGLIKSIYPLPVDDSGIISVEWLASGGSSATFSVKDIEGREVMIKSVKASGEYLQRTTIDMSALAKGVYFIQISCGNKTETRKVVK